MKERQQHLVLIDGYGFLFRAFHAFPPLKRLDGVNVGGVYGFTAMLTKVILEFSCSHLAVVFDPGGKNHRHALYPEYKAHRPPAPEELIPQFPLIREAVSSLNIDILEKPGFEADDVIATYAKMASNQGIKVTIISSDKDLMQLIDDNISLYDPIKAKKISFSEVKEKFGVTPCRVVDVLSLIGDTADNVPGVPGIGPKTAAELIENYHSLDGIYQNLEAMKESKRKQSLIENKDKAYLSQKLVILDDQVDHISSLDDIKIKISHVDQFKEFLLKQNFQSLYAKAEKICQDLFKKNEHHHDHMRSIKIIELKDKKNLEEWLKHNCANYGKICLIIEAGYLCIACSEREVVVISSTSSMSLFQNDNQISELTKVLVPYLKDESIIKIVHDAKRLYHLTGMTWTADDIQLMSYVLNNGIHSHDLKTLTHTYFENSSEVDLKKFLAHCAYYLLILWDKFRTKLVQDKLLILYERIEKPLSMAIYHMEKEGILLDKKKLENIHTDFTSRIQLLEKEIFKISGEEFNIASPKQLADILFNKLNLNVKNNKNNSTNAEILEELVANGSELAKLILNWRHLSKLTSTYTNNLSNFTDLNSRLHTSFQMCVTSTGRLSSINPNLQNIPIKTEDGIKIRSAFVAKKGYKLISADYSQIELRLMAHIAEVEQLKNAFLHDEDIHAATASEVFNVPLNEVSKELRRRAKTINFGIIYGQSSFGLASQLGISKSEAAQYINSYFHHYPGIKKYMEDITSFARLNGYVETLLGRKCYFKNINDSNVNIRNFAERAAINAPLQGSAADIIKKAMIQIDEEIIKHRLDAKMVLQIHDELLFEVNEVILEKFTALIRKIMESTIKLSVPLKVNISNGANWSELSASV